MAYLCLHLFPWSKVSLAPNFSTSVAKSIKVDFIPLPLLFLCSFCIPSSSSCKLSSLAFLARSRMPRQLPVVLRLHPSVVVWHFYSQFNSIVEKIFTVSSTRSSLVLSSGFFILLHENFTMILPIFCMILSKFMLSNI